MYKTIVVEDEVDVRKAIISAIDWTEKGFSIVGEASNGQEALELMQTTEPDLVITDISMPFMDGIALATAIRETNPVTKIVFLSGFNEFDYAISALKLNVIEYILKPVSRSELYALLERIRDKLDAERRQSQDVALLRAQFDRDRSVLRSSFLIALIRGKPSAAQIAEKVERYGLRLLGESFVLLTICAESVAAVEADGQRKDVELLLLSALDIACRVSEKYLQSEAFIYEENVVVILSDTAANIESYADIATNEIYQHIGRYGGFDADIGVSRPFARLSDAPGAYADSVSAIHYRLAEKGGRVFYIGDYESAPEDGFLLDAARESAFQSILKTGDRDVLTQFIDQLFEDLRESRASLQSYQICILQLFSLLLKTARSTSYDLQQHIGNQLNDLTELYKRNTADEMKAWLETLCLRMMHGIDHQRRDAAEQLAALALAYIAEHYTDSTLSMKSMSAALHVSPNYLSSVIKRATGKSFTAILTRVRMEKAYELLLSTNQNLQDIAEQTGYSDRHYFSYCFKRYYDSSPLQMRGVRRAGGPAEK